MTIDWTPAPAASYADILYELSGDGIAKITINRPERRNAFRPETVIELQDAFARAHRDPAVGAIVLTGAGDQAFCSGGDQKVRGDDGGYHDAASGTPHLNVLDLQMQIRRLPKPVVAMVAGYASAAATCCTSSATSRSPPTTRASARPARASAASTRASAPASSRAPLA